MASVERVPAETKTEVVEICPEKIVLTLNRVEAEYIAKVAGMDSATGTSWDIFDALYRQGITGRNGVLGSNLRNKLGL